MRKIATYTLISLMLQFNVALADCEWQLVEETPTYVREQCKAGTGMGARIRTKDINGEVGEFKVVGKQDSPIKKFKDKVEEAPKVAEKVEKVEEIEKEVIVIGAGLAGSEAAWQVAKAGVPVKLIEMLSLIHI